MKAPTDAREAWEAVLAYLDASVLSRHYDRDRTYHGVLELTEAWETALLRNDPEPARQITARLMDEAKARIA